MKRNSLKICSRCIGRDRKKALDEPYFFSAANNLDFGEVPGNLPDLTMVEEMLIARIHVHVKVLQVRGAQYKYRGHVIHFLRNIGRLFEELPVLPKELDIVLLRPPNMEGDPRFQQQFARDFRVRRSCLLTWLHYLHRHHPGYRDIVVSQDRLQRLPLDGSIVASIASQVADIPDGEIPQGPVEEALEEDPFDADASAIPNLQVTDTELNALQSRVLDVALTLSMPLPSIRRTPIDEFNRSQPLLSLAFPTLYPDGKADFVEPRLRSITYQDYLGHAMRWHDGRFARHKTWPFVALNTLLQEAMAEPDEPEAQDLIQSITRQAAVIRGTRPPGLFVTAKWKAAPEAARMVLSRQLLRDNAHIAAYHFYKRYTLLTTIVLKQNGHPDLDPDDNRSRERFARIWGYHVSAVNPEPHRIQHWTFRGERNDGQINHYNRLLTVAWLANTDVSPCTSLQQVIDYAAKYCSKSEKKSESFAQIGKALMPRVKDHNPLISFTSKLLNQLVAERDYSKQEYGQRPEALKDLTYVSFLKHWNFRSRDPSAWKQWRPGNVNGRPVCWFTFLAIRLLQKASSGQIIAVPSPIVGSITIMVMTITASQKRLDYSLKMINMRLCLWGKNLMTKTGFASLPFYLTTPLPRKILTFLAAAISTSITTGHGIHPMANDVEVLGPQWRNTLNPQQRLVYDTFMGHFQARNPTQILLHVDGGGGTGKSFLIKVVLYRPSPADAAALQSRLRHVKYLVIDEKSMLGIEQLARIDSRLRQAFPQRSLEFFGGRQAGDDQAQFRRALQELREVKLSIPSWNLLSSRARVNEYNYEHMVHLNAPAIQVEAKNQGKGAGQAPSDNAGNLSNKFPVAKGARGTVYDIAWNPGAEPLEDPPAVIMVDFDSYDGPPYLTTNEGRKISPILPSLTKEQIVTDLATRDFQAGISYVAVSRVTSLQGLLLEAPFDRQSLYNHTPTEGMKMRLADQQRRQGQQLSDAPYPPLYLD
ncbi:ATP-dependent DNA helicase PIF1 [Hirsutella rhossiliensis]|uniref:ATP-dependent DNA helicase PIF1 n=1 Tax=Hirsutella rhossiliensis TaxID=111463 RepID=A0A9P8SH78_9HYPO|nr:ATP-dependent DNA helicase PIF1 [Hirsutella rhossiliensis]KAH0962566.1 ATP-dependent DNA helicase PIF1 [Hirsutella rhossiliensis]